MSTTDALVGFANILVAVQRLTPPPEIDNELPGPMNRAYGWGLLTITFLLVVIGCSLYWLGSIGWAQLFFVLASGTAGAGVVLVIEGGA